MDTLSLLPIPLLQWYQENARVLPWRSEPTPYRVWVSEIMLQQTRVAAVIDYFQRFMEALPTVEALAQVDEDQLLKLWQGLGYYNRARNLQKAARQIMTEFGGRFPDNWKDIRSLCGVGDYTAGAIASIAFGLPYPAVDGNVLRVVSRITGDETDITSPAARKKAEAMLTAVMPKKTPGDFNQALMELGALVCLPNGAPSCDRCPASGFCVACLTGRTGELPVKAPKKARKIEERKVFLIFRQGRVALRRRQSKGLLAGLWEFPNEQTSSPEHQLRDWGVTALRTEYGGTGRHIFTHIEWHMEALVAAAADDTLPPGWVWADREELSTRYALPNAFAPFAPLVDRYL